MRELSGYRHLRGVHCASAALRNVHLHHTGESLSEAMCFGLAAGLNFTYVREYNAPFFLVMGRGSFMESHFCDALDVQLEVRHADDPDLAWEYLKRQVDQGRLTMIDADMFELPYMVQQLKLGEGVHFGGHKALVTGYDSARGTVRLADYAWLAPREVTLDEFKAARDSRLCPSRPRNACFNFHYPSALAPIEHSIETALRTMANQMRYPFLHFNGLPAVERFCRQVPKWHLAMRGDELIHNCSLAAFMLEKAGTGGGGFRNLYSRFLAEAAERLAAPLLAEAGRVYAALAGHWREVAGLLERACDGGATGMFAPGGAPAQLMREVAALEARGIDCIVAHLERRPAAGGLA